MTTESLSAAEKIIQTMLQHVEHLYHNRPGIVKPDGRTAIGVSWTFVSHKVEDGRKVVYSVPQKGSKSKPERIGVMQDDMSVVEGGRIVGRYQPPGYLPEAAAWAYSRIAEVWKSDNEFAARWASYAYSQDHRDMKVALCAFMLVQDRKGDPVRGDDGKIELLDEDYREVGEAMALIVGKTKADLDMSPKHLLRVHDFLCVPQVAEINRQLGFTKSSRRPATGRWERVVQKWLAYREENPKLLKGLVDSGYKSTVQELARRSGFKPSSDAFFKTLGWKQHQAKDGRRTMAIGQDVVPAKPWDGLDEAAVCAKIVEERPGFKRLTSLLPKEVGLTSAVMAAAVEAGCLSGKDLLIYMPTLESLGLLQDPDVRKRVDAAVRAADDMRAANVAKRLRSQEAKDLAAEAADAAVKKAVEDVRGVRVYVVVDKSASMEGAIEVAKTYISQFVQGLPEGKTHVSTFDQIGREVLIKSRTKAGVENAFRGLRAGGGTNYGEGVRCLSHHVPSDDEDSIVVFIGDERNFDTVDRPFDDYVRQSGIRPTAFGLIRVPAHSDGRAVRSTAAKLGIPCFEISEATFSDPYAVPRTIRALIASTPVTVTGVATAAPRRESLVDIIKKTELLRRPVWAA